MPDIAFQDGATLRTATALYYQDGATLRTITEAWYQDGATLRKVWPPADPAHGMSGTLSMSPFFAVVNNLAYASMGTGTASVTGGNSGKTYTWSISSGSDMAISYSGTHDTTCQVAQDAQASYGTYTETLTCVVSDGTGTLTLTCPAKISRTQI